MLPLSVLRLHWLQHVPFEDAGHIVSWANARAWDVSRTCLYDNEPLPPIDEVDWLVVMGGPMSVHDEAQHRWLVAEKQYIETAIRNGRVVIGICLGAQLIAEVLGASVRRAFESEIGWLTVERTEESSGSEVFSALPDQFTALHWHGETFDIPDGATHLARTPGCESQAFEYGRRVWALQFHLETDADGVERLIENCRSDIEPGPYVQQPGEMIGVVYHVARCRELLDTMLDRIADVSQSA